MAIGCLKGVYIQPNMNLKNGKLSERFPNLRKSRTQ
jgi:hypothetical protein